MGAFEKLWPGEGRVFGDKCYQGTFWTMAVSSWVALGLWGRGWRWWVGRGIAVRESLGCIWVRVIGRALGNRYWHSDSICAVQRSFETSTQRKIESVLTYCIIVTWFLT